MGMGSEFTLFRGMDPVRSAEEEPSSSNSREERVYDEAVVRCS